MKIYFRILHYAPRLARRLVEFFLYSFPGSVFQVVSMGLVAPLLNSLFSHVKVVEPGAKPEFALSIDYATNLYNYYLQRTLFEEGALRALLFVCISMVAARFLGNVFTYLERMAASRIKVDVVRNMRMHIFRNATNLHIGYFNDQRKGDLISRFTNDVSEVENAVVNSLKFVWKEPITIIISFVALFFISAKLTLFSLVLLPIVGGVVAEIIKRLKLKAVQSQESLGRIVNILDETLGGMRVVQAFNARGFILKKMDQETDYHRRVNLSIARKNELASPMSEILGVLIVAAILYFGGTLVLAEDSPLTPGAFLAFIGIFASIIQPAKNFSNGITSLQKGMVSAQRIFELIDKEPAVKSKPNATVLTSFETEIEFRNMSFAYDREPVLKDINLKIGKGKTIALVGSSGGGKSTLADLIPRFYDPTGGDILLDGISLRDYELESLRKQIGVVTQESILFNDSIFNNIAFGIENPSKEAVIHAAQVANAHDFIMQTEHGYDTVIGERGSKLSGGQRQRLSIARAVLKNPPILILDEATSALDSESERLVQDALTKLMQNRTSVVIAHRLSTIQHADEIVVIQQGQILEKGRHELLMAGDGLYKKLIEIQKVK
ncbi:ABC transporter ATP-binding protein [Chryseolinea lacunae]|uniref:ABC transporter ATP-binding protein n=1 Tax=Chryseolinea lacunae TaxID=2801331 RepID=A0ABS1KLK6_9BACT|nr:ABC transporter ATP-binding protein [Chryseolinea lacunae]MBL0740213.1 ABC transporter ATP-binding protein [Chryseolinea lacunae]